MTLFGLLHMTPTLRRAGWVGLVAACSGGWRWRLWRLWRVPGVVEGENRWSMV